MTEGCNKLLLLLPRSLYGNVSMGSCLPAGSTYIPVESVLGRPRLRSASTASRLLVNKSSTGQWSFSFHGLTVWNSLPSALRDASLSLKHASAAAEDVSACLNSNCTSPGAVVAFCDFGAAYKCQLQH